MPLATTCKSRGTVTARSSAALSAGWGAAGRLGGFFEYHLHVWDALAAGRIVLEAGGVVNKFLAGNGLGTGNPLLVSTLALAESLREVTGIE